jgi:hypothetical protein
MRQTSYAPDPPQRHLDNEWPQSVGLIEDFLKDQFPVGDEENPGVVRLARLQRSASISYQPCRTVPKPGNARSEFPAEQASHRGRSRRRQSSDATRDVVDKVSSWSDDEKLGYRSRR